MLRMKVALMMALAVFGAAACSSKTTGALPDDMDLGNARSKITVVEYASVGCPVCAKWYREIYPAFKTKYVDSGKVHYVFREMLVGGGPEIAVAASGFLVARCAGKDKYFAVNDAIFTFGPSPHHDPFGRRVAANDLRAPCLGPQGGGPGLKPSTAAGRASRASPASARTRRAAESAAPGERA